MKKLSRREVLASGIAASALPLSGVLSPAFAANKLTIGFISPITGPLGGFGQTDGHVLTWKKA
jgi:branched-chain amino acid transport system substrate-binding protein